MKMRNVQISVIIPVKEINEYLRRETIPAILKQTFRGFEIIILPDKPSKEKFLKTKIAASFPKTGPADKRDIGGEIAQGEILAFLDDDSYPAKDWLKNALRIFNEDQGITGVCGPALTPPNDNLYQKISGRVWSSWLGSGGAGIYRCVISKRRRVDDYPTVNFLVRREDFWKVGGFDSHYWPGEDTKLCHDLTYKLKKKIIYDPEVLVYHHRREVFWPHLEQIGRYAVHRGYFARILPKTSLKFGYLLPTIFVLALAGGPVTIFLAGIFALKTLIWLISFLYLILLASYCFLLLFTAVKIFFEEKDFKIALLIVPSIFLTHLVYGTLFVKGYLLPKLTR